MSTYLTSLALFLLLACLADTRITFSPFSISFGRGWLVLGIISIVCGCICLKTHWYEEGLKKGAEIKEGVKQEEIKQQDIKREL